jgi:hypothetical protein
MGNLLLLSVIVGVFVVALVVGVAVVVSMLILELWKHF